MSQFKLVQKTISNIPCHVIEKDDGAEFEVFTGYGAGLNAWRVPCRTANGVAAAVNKRELLFGYKAGDDVFKIGPDTNAGCRLAPFPGRVNNAQFIWNSITYKLINNVTWAPHALHGFLQNQSWNFVSFESDADKATLVLSKDWPGAFAGFPFPFRAVNEVTFTGDSYSVKATVTNIGKSPLPYSEGWHPYYSLGQKIDGLTLTLPPTDFAELDKADIPTGKTHPDMRFVGGNAIADTFINDCFCLGPEFTEAAGSSTATNPPATETATDKPATAHIFLEGTAGTLDIWQNAGPEQYNTIQIYTPPTRDSIAIEPMTCVPDALNHHQGLIVIPPGESRRFQFGAVFSQK